MAIKVEILAEKIAVKGSVVARHLMDGDVTNARIAIGELGGYLDLASNQLHYTSPLGEDNWDGVQSSE